ncbi:MAG TPA: universal stress protein [Candidatus Margulisiibacteriota bacterium]|nr:universal stress protein [Candidatus Margulisiibacteriota bacterium]
MAQPFKIDRVLFATDLSLACEPALRYATAMASRFNAELFLLHVVPAGTSAAAQGSERRAAVVMGQLRQRLLNVHDKFTMAILSGDPAARILQKAHDVEADLIVMGTSERNPAPGCVTDKVVCGAPCPVLTVPHARELPTELHP